MQRRATAVGAALLAVALLTGCTGDGDAEPEPTATDGRTPVPTDAPSTVEQWADIAERQTAEWHAWETEWDAIECGSINDLGSVSVDCTMLVFQAVSMTEISSEWWAGATTPGHSQFISTDPPAEIADLVTATQEAAVTADAAGTAWTDAECGLEATEECPDLADALGDAIAAYTDQLAEWAPYFPPAA